MYVLVFFTPSLSLSPVAFVHSLGCFSFVIYVLSVCITIVAYTSLPIKHDAS